MTVRRILHNTRIGAPFDYPMSGRDALAFHARLPGYALTPLVETPDIARRLGVARVWVKDESQRLGWCCWVLLI